MKHIAVISHIYANINALQLFLKEIDKNYNVEYIINVGNFINYNSNPCEVFDLIMGDKRFINVLGNVEKDLIDFYLNIYQSNDEIEEKKRLIDILGKSRMENLITVPLSKSIELYGKNFFIMHSKYDKSFHRGLWEILNYTPIQEMSKKELAYVNVDHNYLIVTADYRQEVNGINPFYIQPGAISSTEDKYVRFTIIELKENKETIIFKKYAKTH